MRAFGGRVLGALALAAWSTIAIAQAAPGVDGSLVTTEAGVVRGAVTGSVISWKGIPYAAPPVGPLRWCNPQPSLRWSGVRDATRFGPACLQADDVPKSEDCLTINVWRPLPAAKPLPVMVWIHGGAINRSTS